LWVAYLSAFGSVVALGCYLWLLRTTSPALATTYAFVNPAVAVGVGAWWGSEPTGMWTIVAAGIIIAAVALIVWSKARKGRAVARASSRADEPNPPG
jgi:drug/metabolite transporter (DMT)-like permease